jgi:hypothetical protein
MESPLKTSTARVAEANPRAVALYKEMRGELLKGDDLDAALCETLIVTQLALLGHEAAFKMHAQRLFGLGISRERLDRLVLVGLGVTFVIPQAAKSLEWVSEAHEFYLANLTRT